jgi:hypothetical protein
MARKTPTETPAAADVSTAPYDPNTDPRILAKRRAQGLSDEAAAPAPVETPAALSESEAVK